MQQRGCNTWEGGICAMCQGMIKRGERIPYFETKSGCTPEKWWVGKWYFPKRPFLRVVGVSFREGIYSNKSRVRCVRGGQLMKDMIFPYSWDMNTHTHTHTHTCIYIYIHVCVHLQKLTINFWMMTMMCSKVWWWLQVRSMVLSTCNSSNLRFRNDVLPSRSLTVRPWKVTFPIGKDHLPTIIFRGWAMLNCLGYDVVV